MGLKPTTDLNLSALLHGIKFNVDNDTKIKLTCVSSNVCAPSMLWSGLWNVNNMSGLHLSSIGFGREWGIKALTTIYLLNTSKWLWLLTSPMKFPFALADKWSKYSFPGLREHLPLRGLLWVNYWVGLNKMWVLQSCDDKSQINVILKNLNPHYEHFSRLKMGKKKN